MPLALEMGKRDVSVSDLLHPLCCRKRECCGITAWCLPPGKNTRRDISCLYWFPTMIKTL